MHEELIKEHLRRWETFKIEFLNEKDMFYQLDSSIVKVSDDFLIVEAPKYGNDYYELPVNSEVSIAFYRRDGILHSQTTILARQSGIEPRLKITYPYNIQLVDRRRSKRVPLHVKMEIEYFINKNSLKSTLLEEVTQNVSATGISFISSEPLGNYARILCKMYMGKNFTNPILAECKFVYSKKKEIRGEIKYKNALEFIKISREDFQFLKEKCYRSFL